jgi:hypothetical protein
MATATSRRKESEREFAEAEELWGPFTKMTGSSLRSLICKHHLSVSCGDLLYFNNSWYVTHTGLLNLARRRRCSGIRVRPVSEFCDSTNSRYVFQATVFRSRGCKGFMGYGDADPLNVSPVVHGAEMRIAETRAVNRALRKAYGIGICSVEEIGSFSGPIQTKIQSNETRKLPVHAENGNGIKGNGTRVRDRLCQIIRQHQLDPVLVKAYAADFCGTKTLREASREQVENFVVHLSDWSEKRPKCPALPIEQLSPPAGRCSMKRRFEGLHQADQAGDELLNGLFLVLVSRAQYRWHARKPYYLMRFSVLEPEQYRGRSITGRLHCTPKAIWKLSWFLRDFGYDSELLERDEIDEKGVVGLRGVVKISCAYAQGTPLLNLDSFAPATEWKELSAGWLTQMGRDEVIS